MPTYYYTPSTINSHYDVWVSNTTAATTTSNYVIWQTMGTVTTGVSTWHPDAIPQTARVIGATLGDSQWAAKRRRARRRALSLLLHHLSPTQRQEYRDKRRFTVVGGTTGTHYRIRQGRMGNIDVCRDVQGAQRVVHRLCCHPASDCPDEDVMLAQALHLAVNEEEFVRTANVHRLPQHVATQDFNLAA